MMNFDLDTAIRKVRKLGVEYVTTKNPDCLTEFRKLEREFDTHEEELRNEFFYCDEVTNAELELKRKESEVKYNCIEEAVKGLKIFQTYRLESTGTERETINDALFKVGIDPMQITELINELQKNI